MDESQRRKRAGGRAFSDSARPLTSAQTRRGWLPCWLPSPGRAQFVPTSTRVCRPPSTNNPHTAPPVAHRPCNGHDSAVSLMTMNAEPRRRGYRPSSVRAPFFRRANDLDAALLQLRTGASSRPRRRRTRRRARLQVRAGRWRRSTRTRDALRATQGRRCWSGHVVPYDLHVCRRPFPPSDGVCHPLMERMWHESLSPRNSNSGLGIELALGRHRFYRGPSTAGGPLTRTVVGRTDLAASRGGAQRKLTPRTTTSSWDPRSPGPRQAPPR